MPAALIFLIALSGIAVVGCLALGMWLWRMVDWEVVEDDGRLHERFAARRRGWAGSWLKPKVQLLTYRRDKRGRFRRYRR